jgi:hypothetical protein
MIWWTILISLLSTIGSIGCIVWGHWYGVLATSTTAILYGLVWFEDEDNYVRDLVRGYYKYDVRQPV